MRLPARAFTAESFELEGRLLLAARFPTLSTLTPPPVQFESATSARPFGGADQPIQVVTQQAGEAIVKLSRADTTGSLPVEVRTNPSLPGVGVNVGAVDQTVTFADGQSQATLTVPILAGAPNPGEVDVSLYITPVNDTDLTHIVGEQDPTTLDLKIVESNSTLPLFLSCPLFLSA